MRLDYKVSPNSVTRPIGVYVVAYYKVIAAPADTLLLRPTLSVTTSVYCIPTTFGEMFSCCFINFHSNSTGCITYNDDVILSNLEGIHKLLKRVVTVQWMCTDRLKSHKNITVVK